MVAGERYARNSLPVSLMLSVVGTPARAVARSPGELVELQKGGIVSEGVTSYALLAEEEAFRLATALGGVGEISEQKLLLIQDVARPGFCRAHWPRFQRWL